jgi:hypothetical protein
MDERELAAIKPCVGCGYCCKKSRCALSFVAKKLMDRLDEFKIRGKMPKSEPECPYLYLYRGRYRCFLAKHHVFAGMLDIGEGCCCSMNTERRKYATFQEKTRKKA